MMEQKINIAELLKDCPSGMELNCLMYEDVYFDYVDEHNIIHCYIQRETYKTSLTFNQHGTPNSDRKSKCVIFPKGKTTWEGFVPPCEFKDGDVVVSRFGDIHLLRTGDSSYCAYRMYWTGATKFDNTITTSVEVARLATEEEKQKLFDAIKDNGYNWNAETKTLEKIIVPKFKAGDKIVKKDIPTECWYVQGVVTNCNSDYFYHIVTTGKIANLHFKDQDEWELAPVPKFKVGDIIQDITGICKVKITEVNVEDKCYLYKSLNINGIGGITFNRQDDW